VTENHEVPQDGIVSVLVAGATGFAGASVTRELSKQGYKVYTIARDAEKLRQILGTEYADSVTILKGDLLVSADLETLEKQMTSMIGQLDVVVQTVGGGPLTSNSALGPDIYDLNYKTTSNLVGILERSQKLQSLRLLVYYSSLAAMGMPTASGDQIIYTESNGCNPVLPYECAKLETESFLKVIASRSGFKTVVLRFPQIYGGPDDAFMQMVKMIRKGVFPLVRGRIGTLPVVHIRDVVRATHAIIRKMDRIRENYNVYLICEGSYSYNRLVDLVHAKYTQGGMLRIPYSFLYLATALAEGVFRLLRKPEPLNRRRLVSLTKDRIVDSSKFVETFEFKFEENVQSFLEEQPS
jgi:nucleoside-diphosphate-sugar epimerase